MRNGHPKQWPLRSLNNDHHRTLQHYLLARRLHLCLNNNNNKTNSNR